jgi:hypothetical protein
MIRGTTLVPTDADQCNQTLNSLELARIRWQEFTIHAWQSRSHFLERALRLLTAVVCGWAPGLWHEEI